MPKKKTTKRVTKKVTKKLSKKRFSFKLWHFIVGVSLLFITYGLVSAFTSGTGPLAPLLTTTGDINYAIIDERDDGSIVTQSIAQSKTGTVTVRSNTGSIIQSNVKEENVEPVKPKTPVKDAQPAAPAQTNTGSGTCGGGNIPVKDGQWVATGRAYNGNTDQRECVQCNGKTGRYEGSKACDVVYKDNPLNTVLPQGAGYQYTSGNKDVTTSIPKNCVTVSGNIPTGNKNEKGEYCYDGTWIEKPKAPLLETPFCNKNLIFSLDTGKCVTGQAFCDNTNSVGSTTWNISKKICDKATTPPKEPEITIPMGDQKKDEPTLPPPIKLDCKPGVNEKDAKQWIFCIDKDEDGNYDLKLTKFCTQDFTPDGTCPSPTTDISTSDTSITSPADPQVTNSNSTSVAAPPNIVITQQNLNNSSSNNLSNDWVVDPNFQVFMQNGGLGSVSIKNVDFSIPYDTTMNTSGCGPSTLINALKVLDLAPTSNDSELLDNVLHNSNFYVNCTGNGCASGADSVLAVLQNKYNISNAYNDMGKNKVTSATDLTSATGMFVYQGDVSDPTVNLRYGNTFGHNSLIVCDSGNCESLDSYTGDGKPQSCTIIDESNLKCGTSTYAFSEASRSVGAPSGAYLIPGTELR